MKNAYEEFIASKGFADVPTGFDCDIPVGPLFDFQAACVKWALKRGRAALFEDTGLGKTIQEATWAQKVCDHTGGNVIIAAPLCVAQQTVEEAAKFGITIKYCRDQSEVEPGITIMNYEMIEHFSPEYFIGVALDESGIIKSQNGKMRKFITDAFRLTPYKLSCTATPSPNDWMELGTQAEFLGVMTSVEMLSTFFTHDGGDTGKWRLKGHGKVKFWEWMATWAICIRSPADLGFDGSRYVLPPLELVEHVVESGELLEGYLFPVVAQSLTERRQAKKASIDVRLELAARLASEHQGPVIVWCHLNEESDRLAKMIDGAVEVTGSMSIEEKTRNIMAFTHGEKRVLVSKPSICGAGMNWQFCNVQIFAGMNDSYEQFYQAVRRCYRFGQKNTVTAHIITADTEGAVKANIARKQAQSDTMAVEMVAYMRDLTQKQIHGATSGTEAYRPAIPLAIPSWVVQNVERV